MQMTRMFASRKIHFQKEGCYFQIMCKTCNLKSEPLVEIMFSIQDKSPIGTKGNIMKSHVCYICKH
jgi:hypothetical protein